MIIDLPQQENVKHDLNSMMKCPLENN